MLYLIKCLSLADAYILYPPWFYTSHSLSHCAASHVLNSFESVIKYPLSTLSDNVHRFGHSNCSCDFLRTIHLEQQFPLAAAWVYLRGDNLAFSNTCNRLLSCDHLSKHNSYSRTLGYNPPQSRTQWMRNPNYFRSRNYLSSHYIPKFRNDSG